MDYLLHALFRYSGQLPGPPSTVTDMERFYRTRIPLDRYALRNYYCNFLNYLCDCQPFCRTLCGLAGKQEGVSLGYCHLVARCLLTRTLRMGYRNESRT